MAFQGLLLLEYVVVLKGPRICFVVGSYARSPGFVLPTGCLLA